MNIFKFNFMDVDEIQVHKSSALLGSLNDGVGNLCPHYLSTVIDVRECSGENHVLPKNIPHL